MDTVKFLLIICIFVLIKLILKKHYVYNGRNTFYILYVKRIHRSQVQNALQTHTHAYTQWIIVGKNWPCANSQTLSSLVIEYFSASLIEKSLCVKCINTIFGFHCLTESTLFMAPKILGFFRQNGFLKFSNEF